MTEKRAIIKNININYKIFGSPGKPIFLILHGWGGSSDSWVKVAEHMGENYAIYALDFPFFGKSDDLKETWKVDDYVALVEGFAREVVLHTHRPAPFPRQRRAQQEGINLVAHSFGGRVAIKLAAKNPEWISKIFLCDAAGIKHAPTITQKLAGAAARGWRRVVKEQKYGNSYSAAHGKIPPNPPLKKGGITSPSHSLLRRGVCKILGASDYYNCKNEIMKETFKNVIAEDLTKYLDKIKIPATIIWGEKDRYTPLADGRLMNEKIKDSELHVIKGAGHGIHLYAAEEVCRIIQRRIVTD